MVRRNAADHSSGSSKISGVPETIVELIREKKWDEARGLVRSNPRSVYFFGKHWNQRLLIHELCRLVSVSLTAEDLDDQISDDEEEGGDIEQRNSSDFEASEEDNKNIAELASFVIEVSHDLGPVHVVYPPEIIQPGENGEGAVMGDIKTEMHESILTVTDSLGKTPLHLLCENSGEPQMLQALLSGSRERSSYPCAPSVLSMVTAKDSRGATALHYLSFSRQCSLSSLEIMMSHCEPSLDGETTIDPSTCVDVEGDTPLHWALDAYVSPKRIQQLLRHSKDALHMQNSSGKSPFDQFSGNFIDANWKDHETPGKEAWDNIQAYLKVIDEHTDDKEWLPIHMLASSSVDFPAVFYDIAFHFCKEEFAKYDDKGMLPIHLACKRQSKDVESESSLAKRVIKEYPQAANRPEKQTKRLPLHFAILSGKRLDLVAALLRAYPNALNVKDPVTRLWPFLLSAAENGEDMDIFYSMLRADPSIMQIAVSALNKARTANSRHPADDDYLEEHASRRLRRLVIRNEDDYFNKS